MPRLGKTWPIVDVMALPLDGDHRIVLLDEAPADGAAPSSSGQVGNPSVPSSVGGA